MVLFSFFALDGLWSWNSIKVMVTSCRYGEVELFNSSALFNIHVKNSFSLQLCCRLRRSWYTCLLWDSCGLDVCELSWCAVCQWNDFVTQVRTGGSCDGGASLRLELIQRLETLFWGVHPILKLVIYGRIEKRIVNVGNQCWPFSLVGVETSAGHSVW